MLQNILRLLTLFSPQDMVATIMCILLFLNRATFCTIGNNSKHVNLFYNLGLPSSQLDNFVNTALDDRISIYPQVCIKIHRSPRQMDKSKMKYLYSKGNKNVIIDKYKRTLTDVLKFPIRYFRTLKLETSNKIFLIFK